MAVPPTLRCPLWPLTFRLRTFPNLLEVVLIELLQLVEDLVLVLAEESQGLEEATQDCRAEEGEQAGPFESPPAEFASEES